MEVGMAQTLISSKLSGKAVYSDSARKKVLKAAERLHYVPDHYQARRFNLTVPFC